MKSLHDLANAHVKIIEEIDMTPREAPQIYVDLVRLEQSLRPDEELARREISYLRSKYHDLFSDILREAGISCADRFEATQRAFASLAEASSPSRS